MIGMGCQTENILTIVKRDIGWPDRIINLDQLDRTNCKRCIKLVVHRARNREERELFHVIQQPSCNPEPRWAPIRSGAGTQPLPKRQPPLHCGRRSIGALQFRRESSNQVLAFRTIDQPVFRMKT